MQSSDRQSKTSQPLADLETSLYRGQLEIARIEYETVSQKLAAIEDLLRIPYHQSFLFKRREKARKG